MNVYFNDKKLENLSKDLRKCKKALGEKRSKLFIQRLNDLYLADTLEDVRYLPGHYHELKENRKGQWACDLDHPYRLIFEPHENPIPTDADGRYQWIEIKEVEIDEITNYHEKNK